MPSQRDIAAGKAFVELYTKNARFYRGLRAAQQRLAAFGASAQQIGRRMMMMSAAMVIPFVLAAKRFGQFEDQMLSAQAKTGATADQMARLNTQAKELGRTTSFTAVQVAGAIVNLAKAGFSVQEIERSIPSVLNLARATGVELSEAAEAAAITLRQFRMDASEMPRVVDVMTAVVNNSTQGMSDLGESMKFAGQLARDYGLTIEQVAETLGHLANVGLAGTMGGTALRKIMLQLTDASVQMKLRQNLVEPLDEFGELRAPAEILKELGEHMARVGMTGPQRLALLNDLFQIRAVGASAALAGEQTQSLSDAMANLSGTAKKSADLMDSELGGAYRRFMSVVENVGLALGKAMAPALIVVMDWLRPFFRWVAALVEKNKAWTVVILAAIVAMGAMGIAIVTLGILASSLAAIFGLLTTAVIALEVAMAVLFSPIGLLIVAGVLLVAFGGYLLYASGAAEKLTKVLNKDLYQALDGVITRLAVLAKMTRHKFSMFEEDSESKSRPNRGGESGPDFSKLEWTGSMWRRRRPPAQADPAAMEWQKKWQDRLHDIRISHIEDEQRRAIAEINIRYSRERQEARAAGRDISVMERARLAELEGVRRDFAKQALEASEPLAFELSRTRILAKFSGAEQAQELLKLDRTRAMREAGDDPIARGRMKELFELRKDLQDRRLAAMAAAAPRFAGTSTFGSAAWYKDIAGRGGVDPALNVAKDSNRHLKNIARDVKNGANIKVFDEP